MDAKLKQDLELLRGAAHAFANTVDSTIPQIEDAYDESKELPESIPSRFALAELCFRQIREKYQEIEGIYKMVLEHF